MSSKRDHFIASLCELCAQAQLGRFEVGITTWAGRVLEGIPAPSYPGEGTEEFDDTGFADPLWVGGESVALDDIAEMRLWSP